MKQFWYTADIGTWESGKVIKFKANNRFAALRKASRLAGKFGYDSVVKLRVCGRLHPNDAYLKLGHIIWDEYNGLTPPKRCFANFYNNKRY